MGLTPAEGGSTPAGALQFFDGHLAALPLYEALARRIFEEIGPVAVRAQETQISFSGRHGFACVSFLPVRKKAYRPDVYITVTFGLGYRADSPRIDAAVEIRPGRWTHHVLVASESEIDGELMGWIKEAAAYADRRQ